MKNIKTLTTRPMRIRLFQAIQRQVIGFLRKNSVSVTIIKFNHSSADINRFVAEDTVSRIS